MRCVAHFQPRGVVDGQECQVNIEGPAQWDCTVFALQHRSEMHGFPDQYGWCSDYRGMLKSDPAAPQWIRDWQGPYYMWWMHIE